MIINDCLAAVAMELVMFSFHQYLFLFHNYYCYYLFFNKIIIEKKKFITQDEKIKFTDSETTYFPNSKNFSQICMQFIVCHANL